MKTGLCCLCVYLFVAAVRSEIAEGEPCYTSRNEYGICWNIKQCPVMLNLLRTRSRDPDTVNYLRTSTCGLIGNLPKVCCPESNDINSGDPNQPIGKTIDDGNRIGLNSDQCGITNVTNFRVVGGIPAKLHEIPFIVNLGYRNARDPKTPKWLCGGSLITDRHVLTAAHCVFNRKDLYVVRFGEWDLANDTDGAFPEDINVLKAEPHENYSNTKFINDIAIITVERPVKHPWVKPVCLPIEEPLRSTTFVKWSATVAGWGALYFNGPSSSILQIAQTPVVDLDKCKKAFAGKAIIDESIICAGRGDGRQDTCQGDSGGPLFWGKFEGESLRYYQIGVVSYGYRCAEVGYPGVYTRITHFIDWIQEKIK